MGGHCQCSTPVKVRLAISKAVNRREWTERTKGAEPSGGSGGPLDWPEAGRVPEGAARVPKVPPAFPKVPPASAERLRGLDHVQKWDAKAVPRLPLVLS